MFRKNVAGQFIHVQGIDASTGGIKSGVSWTVRRCIDGTFAAATGTATEDGTTGWYKFALSQADTNGNNIGFNFTGTGAVPQTVNIVTTAADPTDSVRLGLTALPNAAAEAAGGLYTRGSGAGQINQPANGQIDANAVKCGGTTLTGRDIGASVLLSSGTGTGQLVLNSGVADARLADAVSHGGTLGSSTATLALSRLNVTSQTSNTTAVTATGNGTGSGIVATSGTGATGDGIQATAASTNGNGFILAGTGTGSGVRSTGGSTGNGMRLDGGGSGGHGLLSSATTNDGIRATGGISGVDIRGSITGNVTGNLSGSAGSVTGAVGSVTGAVGSVTGNVGGNVVGSVASVTAAVTVGTISNNVITAASINADAITAAKIADGAIDAATFAAGAINAAALATDAVNEIVDQVWEETLTDHSGTSGSTAAALNAAGSAGDPWSTALPGAYGAGTAGKIIGDNINAPIATVDTVVDAIKAKTDSLTFTKAGEVDANIQSVNDVTVNGNGAGTPWGP
jgi:hypothetical protein